MDRMQTKIRDWLISNLAKTSYWRTIKCAGSPGRLIKLIFNYSIVIAANKLKRINYKKPILFIQIDEENFPDVQDRRYFFFLLFTLIEAGYFLLLYKEEQISLEGYVCAGIYQQRAYLLPGLKIVSNIPALSEDILFLSNSMSKLGNNQWNKTLTLDCDISTVAERSSSLLMPYIMHPFQYEFQRHKQLPQLRKTRRQVRIFFSGGLQDKSYSQVLPGNILTRVDIIRTLSEMEEVVFVGNQGHLEEIFSGNDFQNACFLNDRHEGTISDRAWLPTIAQCDFFIAAPGMIMPMCHNVIEAMAVGTIPILNYPGWFQPPLINGENCITFSNGENLRKAIGLALEMPTKQIEIMRQSVGQYYDQHLTPRSFRMRLEAMDTDQIALFVNSDQSQFTSKVHEKSIALGR